MRRRGGERTGTLTRRGDHDRKRKGGKEEQRERERRETKRAVSRRGRMKGVCLRVYATMIRVYHFRGMREKERMNGIEQREVENNINKKERKEKK